MRTPFLLMAAVIAAMTASTASAALVLGNTVTCSAVGLVCLPATTVISASTEFEIKTSIGSPLTSILVNIDELLTLSLTQALPVGGFELGFQDLTSPITAFAFVSGGSIISSDDVTLANNILSIALDQALPSGSEFVFSLERATAVPEPSTWAMMVAGFAIFAALKRRRNRRALMRRVPAA